MTKRCLLYYITDRTQFAGDDRARRCSLIAKIAEASRAGVDYIQLREKDLGTRELEALARECIALLEELRAENRELRTSFLISSRTDVALATGADGVHLRSNDLSPGEVRRIVGLTGERRKAESRFLIAVSCHTPDDVHRAESQGADFAAFAPVFEKKEAPAAEPTGCAALREACTAKTPVLALGGVTIANAASCLVAGASGIAGIRLFQDNKIDDVVRALRALSLTI